MNHRGRYLLVGALLGAAGLVWWWGGLVTLLPVDLQFMHCAILDGQLRRAWQQPSALDRLWLPARTRRLEDTYRRFLRRHPQHIEARIAYGNFLADIGREDEATREWEAALTANPRSALAHNNLGMHFIHRGEINRGMAHLQQAVELDPDTATYHYTWASVISTYRLNAQQTYGWSTDEIMDRALVAYRKARDLAPHDVTYSNAYAEMFYFMPQPNWEEAYDAWRFCLSQPLDELDRERTYGRLARVCMHLRRFDEAAHWLAEMKSEKSRAFRDALERKRLALLDGAPDDSDALRLMRAVSDAPR